MAELEKKIDALTASLHAQSRDISSPDGTPSHRSTGVSSPESTHHLGSNKEGQRAVTGRHREVEYEPEQDTRMPPMAGRADSVGAQGTLKRRFSGEQRGKHIPIGEDCLSVLAKAGQLRLVA